MDNLLISVVCGTLIGSISIEHLEGLGFFEDYIITDENFENTSLTLKGIFLYTEEDRDLVKYIRENYNVLNLLTEDWCDVFVFEKPSPSRESLKKYWFSLLQAELYEKWSLYRWITDTKPFDKNESYKVAKRIGVPPIHFPCLVLLPSSKKLSTKEKLIVPIKEVSGEYFIHLFSILENIVSHSEEIDKYESVKFEFNTIIEYLEKKSNKITQRTITNYEINETNIVVNNIANINHHSRIHNISDSTINNSGAGSFSLGDNSGTTANTNQTTS